MTETDIQHTDNANGTDHNHDHEEGPGGSAAGVTDLPAASSPVERHRRLLDVGMHPTLEGDDNYWKLLRGFENGVVVTDPDELIGLVRDDRCPVCAEPGSVRVNLLTRDGELYRPKYSFVTGVVRNEMSYPPVIETLEENEVYPIVCQSGSTSFLVGLATRKAVEGLREWEALASERRSFKKKARRLSKSVENGADPADLLGRGHSKGVMLAAIYELLGARDYDPRDLIGREGITKSQLLTLIVRLQSVEVTNRRDLTEGDWLIHKDYGITYGRVEWHIPEWAGFEGLNYSDAFRTDLFEYEDPDISFTEETDPEEGS